jgi:D-glycero-alpha-D-manno-heptose-7-phosphate kinase
MVISRTPFRISFFGGGTDYPAWYREHGGCVLAATIDKYCYLTCRYLPPFFEHRLKVVYSKIESVQTAAEITHPAVRETLRFLSIDRGLEIHHDGDLPGRSGMGSSSSFTVGLLHALHALHGRMVGKERLAKESIFIEQDVLKETVGSQDQVCAAYGGFNHIVFFPNGEVSVRPLTVTRERLADLNSRLMLFYTGIKRTASDVASSYVNSLTARSEQLQKLKDLVERSVDMLAQGRDLDDFGRLLHEAWETKRSLSAKISNSDVDELYQTGRKAGALGGKLLGAGGGGFLLLYVPLKHQAEVKSKFAHLLHVPFEFESAGSQIIFFDQERDYAEQEQNRAAQSLQSFRELSSLSDA